MDERVAKIKEFLSSFGNPLTLLLKVNGLNIDTGSTKFGIVEDLNLQLDKNSKIPSGLFFTHNGNHLIHNKKGSAGKFAASASIGPYFNCFYIDIDIPKNTLDKAKAKDDILTRIYKVMNLNKVVPTHIIESKNGYHLYRVIAKPDREELSSTLSAKDFFSVNEYLRVMFGGDPNARGGQSLGSLARIPYTFHWKDGEPYELTIHDTPGKELTFKQIQHALRYVKDNKIIDKKEKDYYRTRGGDMFDTINKVPIIEIILKLNEKSAGKKFFVDSSGSIAIESGSDVIHTDGYKYNEGNNYVNCFSSTYHPIQQRPRGGPYSFVYYYFKENHLLTQKFFKDNFNISVESGYYNEEEVIYGTINQPEYAIEFASTGVFMIPKVSGDTKTVRTYLFRDKIEIIGIGKTNKRTGGLVENENEEAVILMKINDAEPEMIRIMPSKSTFNVKYAKTCFFYGSDNQLGMFFNSIQKAGYFQEIPVYDQNGRYEDCVILGSNLVYKEQGFNSGSQIVIDNKHKVIDNNTNMKPKQYLKKLCEIMDESVVVPTFLQSLALAGMNIRDEQVVYPGLLLTGKTGSGKSTLSDLIKQYLGYDMNARAYGLPALTAQPLSIYASDPEILFLDELTEEVSIKAEELLRNIINRDMGGRGLGNGNVFFNYKAPLFITGERVFREESLNNRFVIINVQKKFQKEGGKECIRGLQGLSGVSHIYETYKEHEYEIARKYVKYSNMLSKSYESRHADVRAYIFVMRDIFEIDVSDKDLISYMDNSLSLLGFDTVVETDSLYDLSVFLIRGIHQKKIIYNVLSKGGSETHGFIFADDSFVETNRTKLRYMVKDINTTLGDELVSINNYDIKINNRNPIVSGILENIQCIVGTKLYKITKRLADGDINSF